MNRRWMAAVAVALALALGLAGFRLVRGVVAQDVTPAGAGSQSGKLDPGVKILSVVERATTDTTVDLGEAGDSVGDTMARGNEVFDDADGTKIGDDQGVCTRIVPGKAWECAWTLILPQGQITAQGPRYDGAGSVLAIVGGTGDYVGASGEMKLVALNETEYKLTYLLK
ncbi:MAG: allene oxide cyclase barrel-like domain-containing protein [Thermomicrobiales bacterium]